MVFRQAYWLMIGAGVASFPVHYFMLDWVRKQREGLSEEYRKQHEIMFHQKMKEFNQVIGK